MIKQAEKLDTLQTMELAEGIEIRLRVAGPVLRACAYLIDFTIRAVIMAVVVLTFFFVGTLSEQVGQGLMLLAWFLMDWFYPVLFEAGRAGATPGKRWIGLRVVQLNGSPITLGQAIIRNFLRAIDGQPMPFSLFGLASCIATKRFQRLGDLAAGTVVVYSKVPKPQKIAAPPPIQPLPLPLSLTASEMKALVMFRERAGLWSDARRAEIADQVSEISGEKGASGVSRLLAMAHWIQEKRG